MIKQRRIILVVLGILFLVSGCSSATNKPAVTPTESTHTIVPVDPTPMVLDTEILAHAVNNLQEATSFEVSSTDIRAFEATAPGQPTRLIYGEDQRKCEVIKLPETKVKCSQSFRYSADGPFSSSTIYYWQEDQETYIQEISEEYSMQKTVIEAGQMEPFAGDVYQTLLNYYEDAIFIKQEGNIAEFRLTHPAWYKLKGALAFANLGLFIGMENGDQVIQQYLSDHFQNVASPVFTIYLDIETETITCVKIDDRDFMTSIWASVDQELLKINGEEQALTKYRVLDENSSTYYFNNFNQAEDFEIPLGK